MATLREYFEEESADCLGRLDALLGAPAPDARELLRVARTLRGTAQMAREDGAYRAALALETAARALTVGELGWSADTHDQFRWTLADLRLLVDGSLDEAARESCVAAVRDRWSGAGLRLPEAGRTTALRPPLEVEHSADDAFRTFAAREIGAIAAALAAGVDALVSDPYNREPLKAILRRQRPLLGTARLDELAVVAESLRAVEDISRVIARLDIAIKDEWLDVYRSAREIMRAASEALERGEEPHHTNALSRLRTLHSELLERYGAAETGPASAVVPDVIAHAQRSAAAPPPPAAALPSAQPSPDAEPLAIEDLMYGQEEALRRIAELRPRIERAVGGDADARAAVDELFDLLRLTLG
jgi:chemotaxis protein histidine kinase CheA